MDNTAFQEKIATLLPKISLRFYEPMAKHTSFRIGGPVEVMAFPQNTEELAEILHISLNHEYRLESGNRSPTIDLCLQISEHFNVSLDSLLCGTIRPASTEKQVLQKAIQLLSDLERQLP